MSDKMWDILRFLKPSQEEDLANALNNREKMDIDSQLLKDIEEKLDEAEVAETRPEAGMEQTVTVGEAKVIPIPEEEYPPSQADEELLSGGDFDSPVPDDVVLEEVPESVPEDGEEAEGTSLIPEGTPTFISDYERTEEDKKESTEINGDGQQTAETEMLLGIDSAASEHSPKTDAPEKESLESLLNQEGLPTEETVGRGRQLMEIPVGKIIPNPFQPRLVLLQEDIAELADSIREVGILQPILVRSIEGGYELIAGERRYRAAKEIGLETIPALIADVNPFEQQLIALVENLQRKNLSAVEEGKCLQDILVRTSWSQTELAKRLGRSQAAVANKIRLLKLDDTVQQWVMEGKLGERQARTLLSFDPEEQRELGQQAIDEELSVKALEALALTRLKQKPGRGQKKSSKSSRRKDTGNQELLRDVAALIQEHRNRGTRAEWEVQEMTEKSIRIEIRVDLTGALPQENGGQVE